MQLDASLPVARGNAYADQEDAAAFGFALFFDARLSQTGEVRCASCHLPEFAFADGQATPPAFPQVGRNSPTILNAARLSTWFWDGRAEALWTQPLFAIESPYEMDFTRLELAHLMFSTFKTAYENVFGALPPMNDSGRFPVRGRPGDVDFDALSDSDKHAVNRVAANVGKALEAYMRKVATGPGRFDEFLGGDADALTQEEKEGLRVFVRSGCVSCHNGPMLTDDAFYNLGFSSPGSTADRGRIDAYSTLESNEFSPRGIYADPPIAQTPMPVAQPGDVGAFRTPALRNLARSGPYGHRGQFPTLESAVRSHSQNLSNTQIVKLVTFLSSLEGEYPQLPWANWPDR